MSRPLRIEYPGAWYHVMNRGARQHAIYHDEAMRAHFMTLIGQLRERFGIQCHGYCLMDNHYHLLLHTPYGNLSRGMRHLNGRYTQYHNALEGVDGPLFRGRYKAILVDADNYLLQLSRYIHRNPIDAGLVKRLRDYPWSSYPYYLDGRKTHPWLYCDDVLGQMGHNRKRYRHFVEAHGEEKDALTSFYDKPRPAPILGSEAFIESMTDELDRNQLEIAQSRRLFPPVSSQVIIALVAKVYKLNQARLFLGKRLSGPFTEMRNMVMYLCQTHGQMRLKDIAALVGLGHYTSVSSEIGRFKALLEDNDGLRKRLERIEKKLLDANSNT